MDEICLPMIRPRELEEGDVSESIHFNTKIKEENIEEEKTRILLGIGVFGIHHRTPIQKKSIWMQKYKTYHFYCPMLIKHHRKTVFFFYETADARNEVFALNQNEKIENKIVTHIKFEINNNEDLNITIDTLFQEIHQLFDKFSRKSKNINLIGEKSKLALCKACKKIEDCSKLLRLSLNPTIDTIVWFLISELLFFLVYKYSIRADSHMNKIIYVLSQKSFSSFYEILHQVSYEKAVFIVDVLWKEFYYLWNDRPNSMFEEIKYLSNANIMLTSFYEDEEKNTDTIFKILTCDRVFLAINKCFKFENKEDFVSFIQNTLQNTFYLILACDHYSVTLMNKSVIIDNSKVFEHKKHNLGYRFILILHEIANLALINQFDNAQDMVDYSVLEIAFYGKLIDDQRLEANDASLWKKTSLENGVYKGITNITANKPIPRAKILKQVEREVFGEEINILTLFGAEFIIEPSNWDRNGFVAEFLKPNNHICYERNKYIEIRRIDNDYKKIG